MIRSIGPFLSFIAFGLAILITLRAWLFHESEASIAILMSASCEGIEP